MTDWFLVLAEPQRQEVMNLRHELEEANAEIARHHRDFERIRLILAMWELKLHSTVPISSIRNVVG